MFTDSQVTIMAGNMTTDASDDAEDYVALLTDDNDTAEEETVQTAETAPAEDRATENTAQEYVTFYTTNFAQSALLASTQIVDGETLTFHGKPVRVIRCASETADEQRKQLYKGENGQGHICMSETSWYNVQGLTTDAPAVPVQTPEIRITSPAEARAHGVYETYAATVDEAYAAASVTEPAVSSDLEHLHNMLTAAREGAELPETAPAVRTPEEEERQAAADLAAQADAAAQQYKRHLEDMKEAQERIKAEQARLKAQEAELKALVAAAQAARDAAPVMITENEAEMIRKIRAIVETGEQGIAKALRRGELYYKHPGKAKKDTGVIRKVTQAPNSNGVVDLHHIGTASTVVTGKQQSQRVTPDQVRQIRALLASMPEGISNDKQVAINVGLDPVEGRKVVFEIRTRNAFASIV